MIIEYWNGASYVTLHATQEKPWQHRNYGLGSDADNNPNLRIRFRTTAGTQPERSDIDNVEVTGR